MTQALQARGTPNWERPRVHGRFSRDPTRPPRPNKQISDLAKLRGVAMRLSIHLQQMMPPLKDAPGAEPKPVKPLPPVFERLLRRHDGIIDGFDRLVHLVVILLDKERETRGPTQNTLDFDEDDEEELDRRIHAELDRIAERKRAAGSA